MVYDLGLIDYEEAYRIQKDFVARRKRGDIDDSVILCEHRSVFTIGRSGKKKNLLVSEKALNEKGIKVLNVDRGGDITFHGPGQLVAYPILDLNLRGMGLHSYLRSLEEAAIRFLSYYSILGERLNGRTGVWVGGKKIASIGICASNWITYHGLSININVDLRFFSMIRPCGLKDIEVTSLGRILERYVMMQEAKEALKSSFNSALQIKDDSERSCALVG